MAYLEMAENALLAPSELTPSAVQHLCTQLMGGGIAYADLYFQLCHSEHWCLEESKIKTGSFSIDQGVGVRAIQGCTSGFAYSQSLQLPALTEAVAAARTMRHVPMRASTPALRHTVTDTTVTYPRYYSDKNPLTCLSETKKTQLLQHLDALARQLDPRVKKVSLNLSACYEVVYIVQAHTGQQAADIRPLVRLDVRVLVENAQGRREEGFSGGGGRVGYDTFFASGKPEKYVHEAVRIALLNLEAIPSPAGTFPVVLGPGWPGVLLHEAIGHGLEGDFNRKKTSAFSERMGERIATSVCTVVDDGTLPHRRGSLSIDDEGTPTQCTTLIDKGILCAYMQDTLNARLTGDALTGNARRESYAHLPMPRMTNTYMLPGDCTPEEIISSVKKGIYAVNFGGGQVDITSGKFVFSSSEAYLIENGKITSPIKGAAIIGDGPTVLTRVSMVGNDLALDEGVGICGKEGQSVPVGVGQPTLKVDQLTVGGTQAQ